MVTESDRAGRSIELFGLAALLVHRTSRDASTVLDRDGLNPAKFQLLRAVRARPGAAQRELGDLFGVTGGNVSMLITKLEAASLLRREAQGAANRVWLTAAGEELLARLEPAQTRFMTDRFGALDDGQLGDLLELMRITVAGLPRAD